MPDTGVTVIGAGIVGLAIVIAHEAERGLPGFNNLIGIESPGLTAAPAIAEYVAELIAD